MDALLLAIIGCLLGEMGGKGQRLTLALATRFNRNAPVIAGLCVAACANAAIAVVAGRYLTPMMSSDARLLFLALAVLLFGAGMVWRGKAPDPLESWSIGPFLTSAFGLFILGFGESAQFLIIGLAVRTSDAPLAGIGGAIGIVAAAIPVILMREDFFKILPVQAIRMTMGVIFVFIGTFLGLSAVGLV